MSDAPRIYEPGTSYIRKLKRTMQTRNTPSRLVFQPVPKRVKREESPELLMAQEIPDEIEDDSEKSAPQGGEEEEETICCCLECDTKDEILDLIMGVEDAIAGLELFNPERGTETLLFAAILMKVFVRKSNSCPNAKPHNIHDYHLKLAIDRILECVALGFKKDETATEINSVPFLSLLKEALYFIVSQ